jgi:hypothetical protein
LELVANIIGDFEAKEVRFLYNMTRELGVGDSAPFPWELDPVRAGYYILNAEAIDKEDQRLMSNTKVSVSTSGVD